MRKSLLLVAGCLGLAASVTAQSSSKNERGFPFITNYSPREYRGLSQVWCALPDDRGVMLFCGSDGVLEFDGTSWRRIPVPGGYTIRSMDMGPDGTIFVGSVGDLGLLAADDSGELRFVSLLDQLPEDVRDFTDVWRTYSGPGGIYFGTVKYLFRWDGKTFKVWHAEQQFHIGAVVGDEFYIREWGVGLQKLVNDELELVPGGDQFTDERIYVMLPWDEGRILIGTRTQGLKLFDGKTFEPFRTEADDYLLQAQLYLPGVELSDGSLLLGTVYGGAIRIDRQGRLLQTLTTETGIINDAVYYVTTDPHGDAWLTTDAGISRIEVGSPFTVFDGRSGITTQPYVINRHEGQLHVGHQGGVYALTDGVFTDLPGISEQIFWLESFGNTLLAAGTQSGVFEIKNGVGSLAVGSRGSNRMVSWTILVSSWDEDIVFVGLSDGLAVIERGTDGRWRELSRTSFLGNAVTLSEIAPGSLWASSQTGGVYRIDYPLVQGVPDLSRASATYFGEEAGLPENGNVVFHVAGRDYFFGNSEIFVFNTSTNRFEPDSGFLFEPFDATGQIGWIQETESGGVWVLLGSKVAYGTPRGDGTYQWTREPFVRLDDAQPQFVFADDDDITWFATGDGIVRYDAALTSSEPAPVTALIRRVTIGSDSVAFGGAGHPPSPELDPNSNELHFEFTTPSFTESVKNRYSTKLEGFDKQWSDWSAEARRSYTNLPPGAYEFLVRARNVEGIESPETAFAFVILPPWYQTWWAYLLFGLFAVSAVVGLVRIRTSQLQIRQRELEKTVEDRTTEIRQRVEELAVINSVQQGLVAEMDMQGIYDLVGDRIRDLFDAQAVVIRTFDRQHNLEVFQYAIEKNERISISPRLMDGFATHLSELSEPLVLNQGFADYVREHSDETTSAGEEPKSAVFVPLVVGETVKGNISLQNVDHENAFSDSDVRLLTTLANSMSVALENARLFDETNRLLSESDQRASELATVNEISKALVGQLEFDALVELIGDQIRDLFKADIVYVAFLDKKSNIINFPYGYGDDFPPFEYGTGLTSQIIRTGEPLLINEDVKGSYEKLGLEEVGQQVASYLGVPISERGEVVGVVSVQSKQEEGRFDENDMRLLSTIAANVGIALQNAESYRELQKTLQDLKSTQEQLVTQEKMASLGQLTAGIAHEIKNPLNFVNNFSELNSELAADLIRELASNKSNTIDDIYEELFDIATSLKTNAAQISKHGRRADSIVKNMMQHASGGQTERFRVEVNAFVDEYVGLAYHGMRAQNPDLSANIVKNFDDRAGNAEMSPQELGRVLLNLVNNALYAVYEKSTTVNGEYQPTVTVSTKRQGGLLEIEVADNGTGIPDHVKDRIFEPLFTTKPTGSGTGLGLSLAFDIVTQVHKGEIKVDSKDGEGTTFLVRIPA